MSKYAKEIADLGPEVIKDIIKLLVIRIQKETNKHGAKSSIIMSRC